jgi:preprotein translocase subunit SecG
VNLVDYLLGFLNVVIVILTVFLIGIILIQRGKGGGLAGAFGGMGGSSAFGTRTGDVFTKITVGVAIAWILLSMLMVVLTNRRQRSAWTDTGTAVAKETDSRSTKSKATSKLKQGDDLSSPLTLPDSTADQLPRALPELPDIPVPAGKSVPAPVPAPAPKN